MCFAQRRPAGIKNDVSEIAHSQDNVELPSSVPFTTMFCRDGYALPGPQAVGPDRCAPPGNETFTVLQF